ncbi:MAG: polymer-forming cytoskeletal protein [Gemmatimonadales bacterium]
MTIRLQRWMRTAGVAAALPGGATIAAAGLFTVLAAAPALAAPQADAATAQEASATQQAQAVPEISASTVLISSNAARLELDLAGGGRRTIELNSGRVLIDGANRGEYEPGGAFERAWRELLRSPAVDETSGLGELLADWVPPEGAGSASGRTALLRALDAFDPSTLATRAADAGKAPQATTDGGGRVTIVPRAGSIGQLADRLEELNRTLGRISGEEFDSAGDFALVVHDDYTIGDGTTIDGDVALLGGTLTVNGEIDGDVIVLGGDLDLEPGALVMGDVRSLGGDVETTGATVTGEILKLSAITPDADEHVSVSVDAQNDWSDAKWDYDRGSRGRGFFGSIAHNIGRSIGDLIGTAVWLIMLTVIGAVLVYFSPKRLDAVASEARADVLRSFGVGLAGQLLFFPIMLLLVVLIVTWLVIPFYLLAMAIAVPAGYVAVARALGEAVVDRRYDLFERFGLNRQNTYYYVFNGFVVLLAPFAIAAVLELFGGWLGFLRGLTLFVGVVMTWAAATTGFGSVIITRGGGLMRDFRGFRRKRSVPLDDVRSEMDSESGADASDAAAGADAEGADDDDEVGNE